MIDPELLAFCRETIGGTMQDSCIVSRKYVADDSTPVESASDGRGGSTGGATAGAVNGFVDDTDPTPCRLLYVPAGKGKGEVENDAIEPFTYADVSLPFSTIVRDADRLIITEAATGQTRTWEVLKQSPHTEQFSAWFSISLVGEDLGTSS